MDMIIRSSLNDNSIRFGIVEYFMKFVGIDIEIVHRKERNLMIFVDEVLDGAIWMATK
jgi:hypothetical protein